MIKYNDVRGTLKTGDLVLFSGNGFISRMIMRMTRSRYSHVGFILKFYGYDAIFLWESTRLSNVRDAFTGKLKSGVQITLLSERIANYDGECSIRVLHGCEIAPEHTQELDKLRKEINNRPYEQSKKELIKSAVDCFGSENKEDLSSIFCSELVAEAYQRLGLLSEDTPSNEYLPVDFSDKRKLKWLKSANLGSEILIE